MYCLCVLYLPAMYVYCLFHHHEDSLCLVAMVNTKCKQLVAVAGVVFMMGCCYVCRSKDPFLSNTNQQEMTTRR